VIQVRKVIGPFAAPKKILIVSDLPKTRSGKVCALVLRCSTSALTAVQLQRSCAGLCARSLTARVTSLAISALSLNLALLISSKRKSLEAIDINLERPPLTNISNGLGEEKGTAGMKEI
jgi:AMP-binding enzyme C-terminal domain